MRCISITVLIILSLCIAVLAEEPPYMLVRVELAGVYNTSPLLEIGLDIVDGEPGDYLEIVCHPADLAQIQSMGFRTVVVIPALAPIKSGTWKVLSLKPSHKMANNISNEPAMV